MIACGGGLAAFGGWQLAGLSQIYRVDDLVSGDTPAAFGRWLTQLKSNNDGNDVQRARLVGRRLVAMRLSRRRDLVVNLAGEKFWQDRGSHPRQIRAQQTLVLNGVLEALRLMPGDGGLWFLAAKLRSRLAGFDGVAGRYLEASSILAPKEGELVFERVNLAALYWPVMGETVRKRIASDIGTIARAFPALYRVRKPKLAAAGLPVP